MRSPENDAASNLDAGSLEGVDRLPAGFGQKLNAAKSELSNSVPPPRFHPVSIGVCIALLVLVVGAISQNILWSTSEGVVKELIRGNLKRLARAGATLVDGTLHGTFTDPIQEETDAYKGAIEKLAAFQASDREIAYVYTCIMRDGKVYFVLDPTPPGEITDDGIESKSHIMDPYPEASPELLQVVRHGIATADIEPYVDRWGSFISGYAPIRDSSGRQVGVLGIDLAAEDYANRLSGIRKAYERSLWVTLLLSLLAGLVAGAIQAKSVHIHRLAADRDRRYRGQIFMTLERVESAMRIAEVSRNRFSDLFEGIPVSCLTFDRSEVVFEWNSEAMTTFAIDSKVYIERDLLSVLGHEIYGTPQEGYIRRVLQGKPFSGVIWGDAKRRFLFNGHPLFGPNGEITGGILAAVDITRQKEAEDKVQTQLEELHHAHEEVNAANDRLKTVVAQLEKLASTDLLTELPNRRAFYDALHIALARAERGKGFALVQADIDYFKLFNDVYGHHAGDEVLKLFGEALVASVRPEDFVARHGGEEFYIILDGATKAQAMKIVERIRKHVANLESGYGKITASFGIAIWEPGIASDDQLMQASDDALYEAKRQGRNRVIVAKIDKRRAA